MFEKIVLATEGSDHSIKATHYAIELARKFNGRIEVVHVIDNEKLKADVLHEAEVKKLEQEHKEKIKVVLDLLESSSAPYRLHLLHGEPGPRLSEFTSDNDSDCMVIGSRGLNNLQTFFLGSVSHKVAKRAVCPVLIVK